MYRDFDYEKSIEKIKSALFDIYENQEIIIGSINDERRKATHVNNYIEVKNKATNLIESITNLYEKEEFVDMQKSAKVNEEVFDNVETKVIDSEPQLIEQEEKHEDNSNDENKEVNELEDEDFNEEEKNEIQEEKELEKFYLEDSGNQPNFAYVSEAIYEKIKNHGEVVDNNIYKIDKEDKKGIIVRTDQFMKLSLSRHRQEGVLKEAKMFRIEQAKKSRERLKQDIA